MRLQKILNSDQMTAYGVKLNPGQNIYGCEGYLFFKNRVLKSDNIMDASYFQGLQYTDQRLWLCRKLSSWLPRQTWRLATQT